MSGSYRHGFEMPLFRLSGTMISVEPLKNVNARTWAPIQSGKVCVRVASAYE